MKNSTLSVVIVLSVILFAVSCKDYRLRRNSSFSHIEQIKQNGLLVRLTSAEKKIESLKKVNEHEKASEAAAKVKTENAEIINTFKEHFDFSEVYFFYPEHARSLREGQFDKVELLNTQKEKVTDNFF